jgi:hypothetical protein
MNARTLTAVGLSIWLGGVQADPVAAAPAGGDASRWQERRLLQPSEAERRREHDGAIFIYDGLAYGTVDRAMDQHFERIENMMFTRIHHPPPSGSGPAYLEDDGCD